MKLLKALMAKQTQETECSTWLLLSLTCPFGPQMLYEISVSKLSSHGVLEMGLSLITGLLDPSSRDNLQTDKQIIHQVVRTEACSRGIALTCS